MAHTLTGGRDRRRHDRLDSRGRSSAADHALITRPDTDIAILATDGAYNTLKHLGIASWEMLATAGVIELYSLLDRRQQWEAHADPDGQQLPAKRYDDKSLAVVRTFPV